MVKLIYDEKYKTHYTELFHKYPGENPITHYRVIINGPTYKALVKEFGAPPEDAVIYETKKRRMRKEKGIKEIKEKGIKEIKEKGIKEIKEKGIKEKGIKEKGIKEKVNKKKVNKEKVEEVMEENMKENVEIIKEGVDIFDFETYKAEHTLMQKYFSGLELVLRTALLIDYKYNYMAEENRNVFEESLKAKHAKKRKEYLCTVLDTFEPLYIVTKWFEHYAPEKLNQEFYVVHVLEKYKHHLGPMFNRMYKARVDPQWPDDAKLWFD